MVSPPRARGPPGLPRAAGDVNGATVATERMGDPCPGPPAARSGDHRDRFVRHRFFAASFSSVMGRASPPCSSQMTWSRSTVSATPAPTRYPA